MFSKYSFNDSQQLLIKPFERISFVTSFILATIFSDVVASFITEQATFTRLYEQNYMQYGVASGVVAGTFIGASQWLVLRRYIPTSMWIFVVTLTAICSSCLSAGQYKLQDRINESLLGGYNGIYGETFSFEKFIIPQAIILIFQLITLLASGYLQWFVLRSYAVNALWWIGIPLILGMLFIAPSLIFISLISLGPKIIIPNFNIESISNAIINLRVGVGVAVQSICFCLLRKKDYINNSPISSISEAPDILNYLDIQKLSKKLYILISQSWKNDLPSHIKYLEYLVGIDSDGTIIAYEPINHSAMENVGQTPLPELAIKSNFAISNVENSVPLAKFKVVFSSPGSLIITSCRGVSLIWLGIGTFIGILAINRLLIFFNINELFMKH